MSVDQVRAQRDPSVWRHTVLDTRTEAVPADVMTAEELEAMKRAGRDAGSFLMEIGKLDMSQMTPEEWQKFSSVLVLGYELHLAGMREGQAA